MDPAPAIRAEGLSKSFGDVRALDGIDLVVERGSVFGLLGPNGAGKTTAVRIFTTLIPPDGGWAEVLGHDVVTDAALLRFSIGLAGQYAAVDENLTGEENLVMVGRLYHLRRAEARRRALDLLERFELSDAATRRVKTYSGGMRRRLDLAASLVADPPVLFLDEPTTGLDPRSRKALWEEIRRLVGEGTTLLLTTQYLEEADRLADRIAVIDRGQIIAQGTSDELKAQVGGDVLRVELEDPARIGEAAETIAGFASADPSVDPAAAAVTVSLEKGASALPDVVRALDEAGLTLVDLSLGKPSLDEVFMSLTGHQADEDREEVRRSGSDES